MANLTIAIDDAVLKQARIRAIEQGTSVNAVLRDYLTDYAKLKAKQEGDAQVASQKACYMKCPKCGALLKERSFQKITIDQCTGCNGIWLDAGEIDQVSSKEESSWLGKFWQRNG